MFNREKSGGRAAALIAAVLGSPQADGDGEISHDPADFARAFRCLAEKTVQYGANPEFLPEVIGAAHQAVNDAVSVGLGSCEAFHLHYERFISERPFDTASVVAYLGSLAESFELQARLRQQEVA